MNNLLSNDGGPRKTSTVDTTFGNLPKSSKTESSAQGKLQEPDNFVDSFLAIIQTGKKPVP
jgi:hypothetical protein